MQTAGLGMQTVPACCVGAFPILDEIKAIEPETLNWRHKSINELTEEERDTYKDDRFDSTTPERNEAAKAVFNKLRPECHKWFPYTPGLSPREHLQEFQMQQLENDRRAFEERLDNSNKQFLAGLEHERRQWEKDAGKWPNRLMWAVIALAVAEVVSNVPAIQRLLGLD